MRKLSLVVLVLVSFAALGAGKPAAKKSDNVSGKFTANGKSFDFKYVYAWKASSPFKDDQMDTFVLLSDQPVADDAMRDFMTRSDLAEQGKLNGIQVEFDPSGEITSGNVYSKELKHHSFSASGMHKWDKKTLSDTAIEGKLYLEHPDDFFDDQWDYSATFKTTVMPAKKK